MANGIGLTPVILIQPSGTAVSKQAALHRQSSDCLKIGTWNVQGLSVSTGKLPNILQEMDRIKVDTLGVTETQCKGEGDNLTDI